MDETASTVSTSSSAYRPGMKNCRGEESNEQVVDGAENEGSSSTCSEITQGPGHANSIPNDNEHRIDIGRSIRQRDLYRATQTGDWQTASDILGKGSKRSCLLNSPIFDDRSETVLHIAVRANQVGFVSQLLEEPGIRFDVEDASGHTAYCLAVAAGASKIIDIMEEKDSDLIDRPNSKEMTPAYIAAVFGHEVIASRLYRKTEEKLGERDQDWPIWKKNITWLFFICIDNDWFDLSKEILTSYPKLKLDCETEESRYTALHMLARKPSSLFSSGTESQGIWQQLRTWCRQSKSSSTEDLQTPAAKLLQALLYELLKREEAEIRGVFRNHAEYLLINAAKLGNYNFLAALIKAFPELVWEKDNKSNTIFHAAIMYRRVDIFRLIDKTALLKDMLQYWEDKETRNNILHLAADMPDNHVLNSVPGPHLQMQKEILFYQELERFVPPSLRSQRNKEGKTPKEVFAEKHKELLKEGAKWMKKNASYSLLVATLIVTVVFPSASMVPSGSKNVNPGSLNKILTALSVTSAIAMGLSAMSMVMLLSLLISRYAEEDFISPLPYRFKTGLVSLVLSLSATMVYFSIATIATYIHHESVVTKSIIVVPQLFPIISVFVFIVHPLLQDTFHSPTLRTP